MWPLSLLTFIFRIKLFCGFILILFIIFINYGIFNLNKKFQNKLIHL